MKYTNLNFFGGLWMLPVSIILLFSSCGIVTPSHHFAYAPSGINAPFLNKKQQLRFSGNLTLGGNDEDAGNEFLNNYGVNFKTAYAITDYFGVTASYFSAWEKDKYNWNLDEAKSISYKRGIAEIGAGYFIPIYKKPDLFFEIYGGYGLGRNSIDEAYKQPYYLTGGYYKNNYSQFFLQPAVVVHHKNLLQAGIFLRTALIKYTNINTSYNNIVLQNDFVRLYDLDKQSFLFFQPAASVRLPLSKAGNLHLNIEINGSFKVSGPAIYSRRAVGLLGITYSPAIKK